jgi:hypothetical protein
MAGWWVYCTSFGAVGRVGGQQLWATRKYVHATKTAMRMAVEQVEELLGGLQYP